MTLGSGYSWGHCSVDVTLPEKIRYARNVSRLGYESCNSYFTGKADIMKCDLCRGVELLTHAMKMWIRYSRKDRKYCKIKFGFMLDRGTIESTFILWRLQEEYLYK